MERTLQGSGCYCGRRARLGHGSREAGVPHTGRGARTVTRSWHRPTRHGPRGRAACPPELTRGRMAHPPSCCEKTGEGPGESRRRKMGGRHTALHCAMDCARLDCARSNFAMTLWTASVTGLGSVTHVETAGAASSIVIVQPFAHEVESTHIGTCPPTSETESEIRVERVTLDRPQSTHRECGTRHGMGRQPTDHTRHRVSRLDWRVPCSLSSC